MNIAIANFSPIQSATQRKPRSFRIFEFGSNSLKCHDVETDGVDCEMNRRKKNWDVAERVFQNGRLGSEFTIETIHKLEELAGGNAFDDAYAVATGTFRSAQDVREFVETIRIRCGLRVRLLAAREEALLLVDGLEARSGAEYFFDLGGWTLQAVSRRADPEAPPRLLVSFPFGAIRLRELVGDTLVAPERYQAVRQYLIVQILENLPPGEPLPDGMSALGSGGTIKKLARLCDGEISHGDILAHIARASRGDLPRELGKRRGRVWLPGLLALDALFRAIQPSRLKYADSGVARGLVRRMLRDDSA